MYLNMKNKKPEKIIEIFCIKDEEYLNPALKITKTHEVEPLWVASLMYLIYDYYISGIDESLQNDFADEVKTLVEMMQEEGSGCKKL